MSRAGTELRHPLVFVGNTVTLFDGHFWTHIFRKEKLLCYVRFPWS